MQLGFGADNAYLDTLADLGPGLLGFRTVMLGEDVASERFLTEIIDLVTSLGPAKRQRAVPSRP